MDASLASYLQVVSPHLQPELASAPALRQVQALGEYLPVPSAALLECRLDASDPAIDLHASYTHVPQGFSSRFASNSAWQACKALGQAWSNPNDCLQSSIRNLILEFDLPSHSTQSSLATISPSPYVMFQPNLPVELPVLLNHVLTLWQRLPDPLLAANLKTCLEGIPKEAELANIGVWLARPTQAVRLTIKDINLEQILAYLEKIGWQDPTQAFMSAAVTLSPLTEVLALAIDIDSALHSRIGLECFATAEFHDPNRWQQLIDHLVKTDLCTPAKRQALLTWPGVTQWSDCPDRWPANLTYGDLLMGAHAVSLFWRKINHIKLVYQPGQPLSAKAYLAFGHRWISRDR